MAEIVETVAGDRRLRLGAFEEFVRTMSIGTNWFMLRVALRLSVQPVTANFVGQLNFGVCQGIAQPYGHPNCTDFVGLQLSNLATNQAWTYAAGPPVTYQNASTTQAFGMTKVAGVPSRTAISPNNAIYFPGSSNSGRGAYAVNIWKIAPGIIRVGRVSPTTAALSVTAVQDYFKFMAQIESERMDSTYFLATDYVDISYAGAALWDSVDIHWTTSDPSVEISDIAVVRFM